MAKKLVIWTETAWKQRREILKYWNLRNKSTLYSEKLILQIKERIQLIIENPEAGKPTNFKNTRQVAMGNFSIYYKIENETLIVTAFWDNRQDSEKLLEILLK